MKLINAKVLQNASLKSSSYYIINPVCLLTHSIPGRMKHININIANNNNINIANNININITNNNNNDEERKISKHENLMIEMARMRVARLTGVVVIISALRNVTIGLGTHASHRHT